MRRKIEVFSRFVDDLATLSKCKDRQVAAIITDMDLKQIYSIGINGGPAHLDDCLCGPTHKYGCVHAEINALIKCTAVDVNKVMFCSLAPCEQCAAAIINSGFRVVYYNKSWKDNPGVQMLKQADILTIKIGG